MSSLSPNETQMVVATSEQCLFEKPPTVWTMSGMPPPWDVPFAALKVESLWLPDWPCLRAQGSVEHGPVYPAVNFCVWPIWCGKVEADPWVLPLRPEQTASMFQCGDHVTAVRAWGGCLSGSCWLHETKAFSESSLVKIRHHCLVSLTLNVPTSYWVY